MKKQQASREARHRSLGGTPQSSPPSFLYPVAGARLCKQGLHVVHELGLILGLIRDSTGAQGLGIRKLELGPVAGSKLVPENPAHARAWGRSVGVLRWWRD